jgi:hypothetical protein
MAIEDQKRLLDEIATPKKIQGLAQRGSTLLVRRLLGIM